MSWQRGNFAVITIPTLFTLARILLTPIIVMCMILGWWQCAFFCFVFACMTDFIDGYLARLLNQQTALGALLDPIADKLLLVSCFITLAYVHTPFFVIPHWFVAVVVSKEIVQTLGALLIYCMHGNIDIQPTLLGKITTCMQMLFIVWLFASSFFDVSVPLKVYYTMLMIMIVLIGASFMHYTRIGLRMMKLIK